MIASCRLISACFQSKSISCMKLVFTNYNVCMNTISNCFGQNRNSCLFYTQFNSHATSVLRSIGKHSKMFHSKGRNICSRGIQWVFCRLTTLSQKIIVWFVSSPDPKTRQIIQRRYKSQLCDQICYAVLCVFSYIAAGLEQKKRLTGQRLHPSDQHPPTASGSQAVVESGVTTSGPTGEGSVPGHPLPPPTTSSVVTPGSSSGGSSTGSSSQQTKTLGPSPRSSPHIPPSALHSSQSSSQSSSKGPSPLPAVHPSSRPVSVGHSSRSEKQ